MLNKAKIIGFVNTPKPDRARKFYEKTLGLKFVSDEPYAIIFDANGIMLRVSKVEKLDPAPHTVCGWDVKDIRGEMRQLKKRGVRFQRYPFLGQDKLGAWTSPSGAIVAWFKDPDGNTLSLTQFP